MGLPSPEYAVGTPGRSVWILKWTHIWWATHVLLGVTPCCLLVVRCSTGRIFSYGENARIFSLLLTAIFPREPGIAGLLKLRMMEVVVTTGAIILNSQMVTTDEPTTNFLHALPVAQPTVSEHWKETKECLYCRAEMHICWLNENMVTWVSYLNDIMLEGEGGSDSRDDVWCRGGGLSLVWRHMSGSYCGLIFTFIMFPLCTMDDDLTGMMSRP